MNIGSNELYSLNLFPLKKNVLPQKLECSRLIVLLQSIPLLLDPLSCLFEKSTIITNSYIFSPISLLFMIYYFSAITVFTPTLKENKCTQGKDST